MIIGGIPVLKPLNAFHVKAAEGKALGRNPVYAGKREKKPRRRRAGKKNMPRAGHVQEAALTFDCRVSGAVNGNEAVYLCLFT